MAKNSPLILPYLNILINSYRNRIFIQNTALQLTPSDHSLRLVTENKLWKFYRSRCRRKLKATGRKNSVDFSEPLSLDFPYLKGLKAEFSGQLVCRSVQFFFLSDAWLSKKGVQRFLSIFSGLAPPNCGYFKRVAEVKGRLIRVSR